MPSAAVAWDASRGYLDTEKRYDHTGYLWLLTHPRLH